MGCFLNVAMFLSAGVEPPTADFPTAETAKIEKLIQKVESLKDAQFIRNDRSYDAKSAGRFLRGKWDANQKKVRTADDFIKQIASRSSTSGKPYLIRYASGKQEKAEDFWRRELQQLDPPAAPKAKTRPPIPA